MGKPYKKEYYRIHNWLNYHYGKASFCTKCTKPAKRYHHALKKGFVHKRDINHYVQLCASCHKKYDITQQTRLNLSRGLTGCKKPTRYKTYYQYTRNDLAFVSVYKSLDEASEATAIGKTCIDNAVHGRSKSAGGFIWKQ